MRRYLFLGVSLLLLSGLIGLRGGGKTAVAQEEPIDPRFGAIESFWAAEEAAELGVGWERILFYWNEIQPTGPDDWNTLHVREEWLVEAQAQGRTVVGLLKNTPEWATEGIPFAGVPRGLYLPVDDPDNLWANYAREVAEYYSVRGVHNWIIWNEPEIPLGVYGHEFSGSVADYYQLLKVAYVVMKEVDPEATIHVAGWSFWHDQTFLERFLTVVTDDPEAAENDYFFDVLSLHIYFRPETVRGIVDIVEDTQRRFGLEKEIWINETNASSNMDPEWPINRPVFDIDLEQQAWFIVQAHALGFEAGAERIGVYKLVDINAAPGDESWGLVRPHDFSKRPAFFAYQATIKYLSGFTSVAREQRVNHYIFTFERPQGVTRVMWSRRESAVGVQVPALAEQALLISATGEERVIVPENGFYELQLPGARCHAECLVEGAPFFLVEADVTAENIPAPPPAVLIGTSTPTLTPSPFPTIPPTYTRAPATATPTASPTPMATATATETAVPTNTGIPTETVTSAPVVTETAVVQEVAAMIPATATPSGAQAAPVDAVDFDLRPFLLGGGILLLTIFGLAIFRRSK